MSEESMFEELMYTIELCNDRITALCIELEAVKTERDLYRMVWGDHISLDDRLIAIRKLIELKKQNP